MSLLAALVLAQTLQQAQGPPNPLEGVRTRQDILTKRDGTPSGLMIRQPQVTLTVPKKGPKTFGPDSIKYDFDWITWGFVKLDDAEDKPDESRMGLRFRIYSQERKESADSSISVARMLLRLWDMNHRRLGIDHSLRSFYQLVNVYLTYGGKPGGEQFMGADIEGNRQVIANNIFIYEISSFTDSLEMAREVAHEYGHATLPPMGPYRDPEDWANGYLGEKLYLGWIRDLLANNELLPDDFMGVTQPQLEGWLAKNVDPLVESSAAAKPTMARLADRSAAGMDAANGLILYMSKIMPQPVFARSLKLASQDARDYLAAIDEAVQEQPQMVLTIPATLQGKPIWIPIAKGTVEGAHILGLDGRWARVVAGDAPVVIKQKPD